MNEANECLNDEMFYLVEGEDFSTLDMGVQYWRIKMI